MKILFYSEKCDYSKKIISYMDKNKIISNFKLINVDVLNTIPKEIDIVPTIIDDKLREPLKGKNAFEYLLNSKYFNNQTNNIELAKYIPSNPKISEDNKALSNNINELEMNNKQSNNYMDEAFKSSDNISLKSIETREIKPNMTPIPASSINSKQAISSINSKQAILIKLANRKN